MCMARFELVVARRTDPAAGPPAARRYVIGGDRSRAGEHRRRAPGSRRRRHRAGPRILHQRTRDCGHAGGHPRRPPSQRLPGASQLISLAQGVEASMPALGFQPPPTIALKPPLSTISRSNLNPGASPDVSRLLKGEILNAADWDY